MFSLRDHPEVTSLVLRDVTLAGRRIGSDAYGSAEEVMVAGAICAAKTVHVTLRESSQVPEADLRSAAARFTEECQLMSTLRHPHVVQFLGVCFLPGARLPALVTERLHCSLHDLLEGDPASQLKPLIPLAIKCSILHNVASGLAYLHHRSPAVVHCDLSARSVLLDAAAVAKIADVGMARIVSHVRAASAYAPPEGVSESKHSSSIDVFSLGIISIFTLGQTFPCDLPEPTHTDRESGSLKTLTELERRSRYVQPITTLLKQGHPLLTLIQRCLCNNPTQRPTIDEVLVLIGQARGMCTGESECGMTRLELIQALHSQPRNEGSTEAKDREINELKQRLQSCLLEKEALLLKKDTAPTSQLETKERQQSYSGENLSGMKKEKMWQGSSVARSAGTSEKTLRVQCYHQKPIKMNSLSRGSAAIAGNFAYLVPRDRYVVFRYNVINGEGMELPNSLYQNSAVVTIDGRVVLIGGESEGRATNKLLTLHYTGQWVEEYPPMISARSHCAAVCVENGKFRSHVIVIGGKSEEDCDICDVLFLNTATKCWHFLPPLPQPLPLPSTAICSNRLYTIGSRGEGYSTSIESLISYDEDESQSPPSDLVWLPLPGLPVRDAAVGSLRGELVLIGGHGVGKSSASPIHQLVGRQWVEIGSTLVPRRQSLTVSPSHEKIIILGGEGAANCVELCNAD